MLGWLWDARLLRVGCCLHVQVNMLLTLEEFCGEEGSFEGMGEQGHLFEPMFGQVSAPHALAKAASAPLISDQMPIFSSRALLSDWKWGVAHLAHGGDGVRPFLDEGSH